MENPVKEITGVIHLLTQSPPSIQRETIDTYFTPNASFTHPFCRTGSSENSRFLIRAIYRWYKILSPRIDITVNSIAYDKPNLVLYINISQIFRIWFVPFYKANVNLTSVLTLKHNRRDGKYYIHSQNDLYQVDEFVKFVFPPGWILVWCWHFLATFLCLLGAVALWPLSLIEQSLGQGGEYGQARKNRKKKKQGVVDGIELQDLERKSAVGQL